ncbi:MAG: efflux RND transporter periplasmic adaptor subunit [Pseudomonadota bacterium]
MVPFRFLVFGVLACALAACEEEAQEGTAAPVVRAIKYITLDQKAGLQERRLAGVVIAAISSNVAFETSGQVVELLRKAGDSVETGELIARLDPEPYQLQVSQAQNSLAQAQASLDDASKKFEQQSRLLDQGFATRTAFDSAESTYKNAQGAVGVAESQLDLAQRDLNKTDLRAPFDGVVARREVEVFEDVTGGQVIYTMQTSGEDKIEASLPETMINTVTLGSEVEVAFPPLNGVTVTGVVDEIAPLAGDANAYPIEVKLLNTPPGLRSGMSAELRFRFETAATGKAFLVPMSALKPQIRTQDDRDAVIYVYSEDTGTLSERLVTVTNVENNNLEVIGDLTAGEIIATAGVSFLHDGMEVTLFDPQLLQ